jgi:beta-lactamase class D
MEPATRTAVVWHGACAARYTPASTFELPLALMGYDSGILKSKTEPTLHYQPGDIDSGESAWKEPTDPERWMRLSVVWYSQRIAAALGERKLREYAQSMRFGNAGFTVGAATSESSRPAWLDSSMLISPAEQAEFVSRMLTGELPVSAGAVEQATALLPGHTVAGWSIRGKTGTAVPRDAGGRSDEARALGWYVGWAEKDGRSLAFAYLAQDEGRQATPAGVRARGHMHQEWPRLLRLLP